MSVIKSYLTTLLFIVFSFFVLPYTTHASNGLVASYNFNECSGTTASDSGGSGNNGTINIGASGAQSQVGTCSVVNASSSWPNGVKTLPDSSLSVDGVDDYVSVPNSSSLQNITSGLTISLWFKKSRNGSFERIISKNNNSGQQFVWGMQTSSSNNIQMFIGSSTANTNNNVSGVTAITDTNWHHYVSVYTASTSNVSIYLDGVLDKSATISGWTGNLATSTGVLTIGRFSYNSGNYYAQGKIDNVQIYNQTITANQILTMYNSQRVDHPTAIAGVNSIYQPIANGIRTITITPDCSDISGTVTYSSSDLVFWNSGAHTWTFTPIFEDGGTIKSLTFSCTNGTTSRSATTSVVVMRDFSTMQKYSGNPIIPYNVVSYNSSASDAPYIRDYQKIGNTYYSITQGSGSGGGLFAWCFFLLYTSTDLKTWTINPINPALTCGSSGKWDSSYINHPAIINIGDVWYMYYSADAVNGKMGLATSSDFINWTKYAGNPIYLGNPSGSNKSNLPSVIKIDSTYYMYYWNMAASGTNVQEYATSSDGINWTYGGVTLPRVVGDWDYSYTNSGFDPFIIKNSQGFYEQVYTIYGGTTSLQELGYAVSADGINWYKYQGPILVGSGVTGSFDYSYPGDALLFQYENNVYLYYAALNSSLIAQGGLAWIQSTTTGMYQGVTNISYSNGTMSYASTSPNGMPTVPLTVNPSSGSVTVIINTWNVSGNYAKQWVETGSVHAATSTHTVGNLQPNAYYAVTVDGGSVFNQEYQADGSGEITFVYNGGYSTHTFDVSQSSGTASVTTSAASGVSTSTVTLNGAVTAIGIGNATQSGFVYGTSPSLATVIATTTLGSQTGTTTLIQSLENLIPNTTYYFQVYAVNSAGTSTGSIVSFRTDDITPPSVSMIVPVSNATVAGSSVVLSATATDDVDAVGVQFVLDGVTNIGSLITSTSSPNTYTTLWDSTDIVTYGSHTLYAVAHDSAGNYATSSVTVNVDNVAPILLSAVYNSDTQITVMLSKLSNASTITKSNNGGFTVTKTGSSTAYAISSIAPGSDSSHIVLTVADMTSAGASGVTVTYTSGGNGNVADALGNTLATNGTGIIIPPWNTTAPIISNITSAVSNGAYKLGSSIDIDLTFSKAVNSTGNVIVTLNTGGSCPFTVLNSTTASCSYTVGSGENTNALNVIDISGIITSSDGNDMVSFAPALNLSANKTIMVDTIAPVVSIITPSNNSVVSGTSTELSATNSDTGSGIAGVQFVLDAVTNVGSVGAINPYSITWNSRTATNGLHTLSVVAEDFAGNYSTSSITIDVENTVPGAPVSVVATAGNAQATVSFDAPVDPGTAPIAGYTVVSNPPDGIDATAGTTSFIHTVTGLINNTSYTFTVTAMNANGVSTSSSPSNPVIPLAPTAPTQTYTRSSSGSSVTSRILNLITMGNTKLAQQIAQQYNISIPTPTLVQTNLSTTKFNRDLQLNFIGSDVKTLQQYLNSKGYILAKTGAGSPGHETNRFGLLTKRALMKFQKDHHLPVTGFFGPMTRGIVGK